MSVNVTISTGENILVQIILNAVPAITGSRKPDEYDVSVNLINADSLQDMNISDCQSIADYLSGAKANIALTLKCNIRPNELFKFIITASNRVGGSLIFKNGNISKYIINQCLACDIEF